MRLQKSTISRPNQWPCLLLMVALATSGLTGCLRKKSSSSVTSIPSSLVLSGRVTLTDKSPAASAAIYLGINQTAITTAGSDGAFTITLDANAISLLSGEVKNNSIRLYAVDAKDTAQQGSSSPINLGARGGVDLADITLSQTATVKGEVLQIASGKKQSQPAIGVRVFSGHAVTTTGDDGSFTLKGVVPGTVTVAAGPLNSSAQQSITVQPGQLAALKRPLVIFPLTGVNGLLIPDASTSVADFAKQGRPFMRTFNPVANSSAYYIRYSSDATQLSAAAAGGAPWQQINDSFDFDFQKNGGSILYYQFADIQQQGLSEVFTLPVVLDNFLATTGLILGDGSGILTSNVAPVTVIVPPAAYRMRVAPSIDTLLVTPWQEPKPSFVFNFPFIRDPSTNFLQGFGNVTLYLQYQDAGGMVSPMYNASATLNLFPPAISPQVFRVNGGAVVTSTRLVQLDINVPPNAFEMLIFEAETPNDFNTPIPTLNTNSTPQTRNIWLAGQPSSFYTFTSIGSKTLYLQFRSIDQAVSPVYKYPIIVQPFADPLLGGFLINGGAPIALSPFLDIALRIPPTATHFRIFDSAQRALINAASVTPNNSVGLSGVFGIETSVVVPWLELTPNFIFTPQVSSGVVTLYIQFKNQDHDVSPVYQRTINIQPQPPGSGAFAVNPDPVTRDSALVTTSSLVFLKIVPPPGYIGGAMTIYEGNIPDQLLANFIAVPQPDPISGEQPLTPFKLTGIGAHTIYVRFKTIDQVGVETLSPAALMRTIFYEPFPLALTGIKINNGAATVAVADIGNVLLALTAPTNVTKMRLITDLIDDLSTKPFQAFNAAINNFALPASTGQHTVYVQYQNNDGDISSVFSSFITVIP